MGTNMLFFLHSLGLEPIPDSVQLAPGVFFGGDFVVLKMFIESGQSINGKVKFMVGYSGWTTGQLNNEVERYDWAVLKDNTAELVFNTPDDLVWSQAVKNFGDQYRLWSTWPDDVSLN